MLHDFFAEGETFSLILKVAILASLLLSAAFALTLFLQVRSLNRIVYIQKAAASKILVILTLLHFILTLSLFLIGVIL